MPTARRADALRNRSAIAEAAAAVFAERGVSAPLTDIADAAGVGIATLHRNFPNRDALVVAVYLRDIDGLCESVSGLLAGRPAAEALTTWMRRFVVAVAGRAGMCHAVRAIVTESDPELCRVAHERIDAAMAVLLTAAVEEGSVRADARGDDLVVAMSGLCLIADALGSADSVARSIGVLVEGLRPR